MEERSESRRSQTQEEQHQIVRDHRRGSGRDILKGFSLLKSEMTLSLLPPEVFLDIASVAGNSNMIALLEKGKEIETLESIPAAYGKPLTVNAVSTTPPETARLPDFSQVGLQEHFDIGALRAPTDSPASFADFSGFGEVANG